MRSGAERGYETIGDAETLRRRSDDGGEVGSIHFARHQKLLLLHPRISSNSLMWSSCCLRNKLLGFLLDCFLDCPCLNYSAHKILSVHLFKIFLKNNILLPASVIFSVCQLCLVTFKRRKYFQLSRENKVPLLYFSLTIFQVRCLMI